MAGQSQCTALGNCKGHKTDLRAPYGNSHSVGALLRSALLKSSSSHIWTKNPRSPAKPVLTSVRETRSGFLPIAFIASGNRWGKVSETAAPQANAPRASPWIKPSR